MYKLFLITLITFFITGCLIPSGYMMPRSGLITIAVTDKNKEPLENVEIIVKPYFNRDTIEFNSVTNKKGVVVLNYKLSGGCRPGFAIKYFHFTLKKDNYKQSTFYVSNRNIGDTNKTTFNKVLKSK